MIAELLDELRQGRRFGEAVAARGLSVPEAMDTLAGDWPEIEAAAREGIDVLLPNLDAADPSWCARKTLRSERDADPARRS